MIFCLVQENEFVIHHVEPRVKLCMPTKNHVDGKRESSDAWTGFTRFVLLNEKPPDRDTWSGWRLTRQAAHVEAYVGCTQTKIEGKVSQQETKDQKCQKITGIFFSERDDEKLKQTMKKPWRKLEIPMSAAMPCKTPVNCRGETCSSIGKRKTKYACFVDDDEFMRIRDWREYGNGIMITSLQKE